MASETSRDTGTINIKPASAGKPPRALMKVMNPVMKAVLRSPLHGKVGEVIMLLTFTGRKSGKQFTTPVSYQRQGDTLVVFTDSPWWKNMRGGAPVFMLVRGKQLKGFAEVVEDKDEVLKGVQDFIRKKGVRNSRQIGIRFDPSRDPTEEEIRAAIVDRVIIRIKAEGL